MYERIAKRLARACGCDVPDILGPTEESDLEALAGLGLPESVVEFYREFSPMESLEVEDARLWSVPQILEENRDFPPGADIHELGFIVIGGHRDGSVYCVDLGADGTNDPPPIVTFSGVVGTGGHDRDVVESQARSAADTFDEFLILLSKGELPV